MGPRIAAEVAASPAAAGGPATGTGAGEMVRVSPTCAAIATKASAVADAGGAGWLRARDHRGSR